MWDDAKQLNAVRRSARRCRCVVLAGLGRARVGGRASRRSRSARSSSRRRSSARTPRTSKRWCASELAGHVLHARISTARRASLAQVPWVRSVALRRQWPRPARGRRSRSTRRSRAGTTRRSSTRAARSSSPTTNGDLPQLRRSGRRAARGRRRATANGRERCSPLGAQSARCIAVAARRLAASAQAGPHGPLTIELGRDDPRRAARALRRASTDARSAPLARAGTRVDARSILRYRNGFAARVPGFREKAPAKKT